MFSMVTPDSRKDVKQKEISERLGMAADFNRTGHVSHRAAMQTIEQVRMKIKHKE